MGLAGSGQGVMVCFTPAALEPLLDSAGELDGEPTPALSG